MEVRKDRMPGKNRKGNRKDRIVRTGEGFPLIKTKVGARTPVLNQLTDNRQGRLDEIRLAATLLDEVGTLKLVAGALDEKISVGLVVDAVIEGITRKELPEAGISRSPVEGSNLRHTTSKERRG